MKKEGGIKKLLKIKGIGYIALALFAGIALLFISGNSGKSSANSVTVKPSSADYASRLESRAEKLIREIDGISGCTVVISLESGYQYHYAYDQKLKQSFDSNGNVISKETETNYKTVTTDGNSSLVLVKEVTPSIKGVAVVCTGISEGKREEVKTMLAALFGISDEKIYIKN